MTTPTQPHPATPASAEAAYWMATLDPAQRPQMLNESMHDVGIRKKQVGEQFVAEQLGVAGASVDFEAMHDAYTRRDLEAACRLISDEMIELCSVAGTPADCRAMLARYAEAGLDILVLNPLAGANGGHLAMKVVRGLRI